MVEPFTEPELFQQRFSLLASVFVILAAQQRGQFDVFQGIQGGDQHK